MHGFQFLRQKPLDKYIVDFFCYDLLLVIEIDGSSHNGKEAYDLKRQRKLESYGIYFLRFWDSDVKNNMPGVLQVISDWIEDHNF